MKLNLTSLLLFLSLMFSNVCLKAQLPSITSLSAEIKYATDTTRLDSLHLAQTPMRALIQATVNTLVNVTGVVVSVGSGDKTEEVFRKTFNLVDENEGEGVISVKGNTISITTDRFRQTIKPYCTVTLEMTGRADTKSDTIKVLR